MDTTLANWTKMSSVCSSSLQMQSSLAAHQLFSSAIVVLKQAADGVPEADTPILEKVQKVHSGFNLDR
jgi:hypothetical protein